MKGVSVIICCYNSSKRIASTLRYLATQKCEVNVEIIVVDNDSEDETINVSIEEWGKTTSGFGFRIISENRKGKTFAFEKGVKLSQYNYILICDDDNWLTEKYIQTGFDILEGNDKIGALGGQGIAVFESESPEWFGELIKDGYAVGPQGEVSGDVSYKGWLYGAGMFLRKDVYIDLKTNGFTNYLTGHSRKKLISGEDAEICYAMVINGYKIWFDERLRFYHYTEKFRTDWKYAIKIYMGYGSANIVLTCYKLAILKNKSLFKDYLWYTELLRVMKNVLTSFSLIKFILFRNTVCEENLKMAKLIGELQSLISNKSVFEANRKYVINQCIKNNLYDFV